MTVHTPGPWQVYSQEWIRDSSGALIAKVRSCNAPLIAAAPEMQDVIKELVSVIDWWITYGYLTNIDPLGSRGYVEAKALLARISDGNQ